LNKTPYEPLAKGWDSTTREAGCRKYRLRKVEEIEEGDEDGEEEDDEAGEAEGEDGVGKDEDEEATSDCKAERSVLAGTRAIPHSTRSDSVTWGIDSMSSWNSLISLD